MTTKLLNGDCRDLMTTIDEGSVDMIITDPPYGMGFQSSRSQSGSRHRKIISDNEIDPSWIPIAVKLLTENGGILMFCNWKTSCEWRSHLENNGLKMVSQVIWDREDHGMGDLYGAFAPQHDVIWYAVKGRRVFENGRPKSVIRSIRPKPHEDHGHPTCKPVDLMRELVKYTATGLVLDPFMGTGSTGVACRKLGLDFIGIEIDPQSLLAMESDAKASSPR